MKLAVGMTTKTYRMEGCGTGAVQTDENLPAHVGRGHFESVIPGSGVTT